MTNETKSTEKPQASAITEVPSGGRKPFVLTLLCLVVVLSVLFYKSFDSQYVHFSNDGPYGICMSDECALPQQLLGAWTDLSWVGSEGLSATPSVTTFFRWVVGPHNYSRFQPPFSLLFTGLCAFFCFRKFKLAPMACVLGAIAVALCSDFFSTSCWGVASQIVGFGGMFLAVGLMYDAGNSLRHWAMAIVAGLGVGIGIMEAYDIGAIFSLFVAAFILYRAIVDDKGSMGGRIAFGIMRVAVVAIFAAIVSLYNLTGLVGTQITGVSAAQQDKESRERAKVFATEWSLPKKEVLQIFIPGIFGYRNHWHMYDNDQPKEDQYWGLIGSDPNVERAFTMMKSSDPAEKQAGEDYLKNPNIMWRLIGTGFYMGIPVVILALWAAIQSFRRGENSPFSLLQRRVIQFWLFASIISLLLSFGRFAPFYDLFYALPYASAIRNPDKFMHVLTFAMLILFAYGAHGIYLVYMRNARVEKNALAKQGGFEKAWIFSSFALAAIGFLGWFVYAGKAAEVKSYIQTVGIPANEVPDVASFSVASVGWFAIILVASTVVMMLIFRGVFSGKNATLGALVLGVLIVFDLGRADSPWNIYWDATYKYGPDPVIDVLADHAYEHRVSLLQINPASNQQLGILFNSYGSHWKQHLFPFHNIPCTEDIQEPRVAQDKEIFLSGIPRNDIETLCRYWVLTSTKYILGPGPGMKFLENFGPYGQKFKVVQGFDFVQKPNVPKDVTDFNAVNFSTQINPNGQLAVMEFTEALPRAGLFSNWQLSTNTDYTLRTLASREFDPHKTVFVADESLPKPSSVTEPQNVVPVPINTNYKPTRIEMDAEARAPSVLMLVDRYNPKWKVEVDGKPAQLLRCNYIMRGVFLEPGKHHVVFRYTSPTGVLFTSLSAIGFGLILSLWLGFAAPKPKEAGKL